MKKAKECRKESPILDNDAHCPLGDESWNKMCKLASSQCSQVANVTYALRVWNPLKHCIWKGIASNIANHAICLGSRLFVLWESVMHCMQRSF